MPFGVFDVIALDAPEAFMLLDVLLHQVVGIVVLHVMSRYG